MKKGKLLFVSIFISLFLLLPSVCLALGQSSQETKNIVVKKGEVINRDFFAAGESVTISGIVNGDVYAAGGSVSVDGRVNGDLLVGAGTVTLLGEVSDDVRIGGGNILINGVIGKNLTVGGGNVTITNEAKIKGSMLALCGNIEVRGPIGRDANVYAGRALFDSQVGGDLKGSIEELSLTSEARIAGDLEYTSEQEAEIAEGALVSGETIYKPSEEKVSPAKFVARPGVLRVLRRARIFFNFLSFIISFLFGLTFIHFFPKRAEGIVRVLKSRPWASLVVGIITPFLFVLGIVLLAITIIGIPLIFLLVPLFAFLVWFARVFAALYLGRKLYSQSWDRALFIGLLIYYVLKMIPYISPLVALGFTAFGLGAFILDQKSLRKAPAKRTSKKG